MTTTGTIAPKSAPATPKTAAQSKPTGGGSAFSAVLGLKLGMGISTTVKVKTEAVGAVGEGTLAAQERSAEPAREAQALPGSEPGAEADTPDSDATELDKHDRAKPSQSDHDAERELGGKPVASTERAADHPAIEPKRAEASRTEPEAARVEHGAEPGALSGPATEETAKVHPAAVVPTTPNAGATARSTDKPSLAPRSAITGRRSVDAAAPNCESASQTSLAEKPEPASAPRDPLGLIRPEPISSEVPKASAESGRAEETKAPPLDLAVTTPAEPRARFADATAADAPSSRTPEPVAAFASPRATPTPSLQSPTVAAVSVAGVSAGGGGTMQRDSNGQSSGQSSGQSGQQGGPFAGLAGGRHGIMGVARPGRAALTVSAGVEPGESREQVQAQIARGLAAALKQKGGVMTLRLNPEHLGSIKIDLTIEAGRVSAFFDAETDAARRILRDGTDDLRRSIEQSGLTAQRIEVAGVATPQASAATSSQNQNPSQHSTNPDGERQPARDDTPDRRRDDRPRERFDDESTPDRAPSGGVFMDDESPAHGLRRLRVDAVV
jgi:flagellar hook-length control protein FliK